MRGWSISVTSTPELTSSEVDRPVVERDQTGLTPLILTALIAAGHKSPWLACTYLVATAAISVVATLLLRPKSGEDVVQGHGL